ncbi:MAG: hypothetical protein AAB305_05685 [Candidatus Zixiibacteriota bacterium]
MQDLTSLLQMAALYSSRQRAGVSQSYGISSRPAPQGYIPRVTESKTQEVAPKTDSAELDGANKSTDANKTYFFQRKSRLDYMMNLRFNLGAFTQAAEKASEGDNQALEELVVAGFGLRADLKFKGHQEISTNMPDEEAAMNFNSRNESRLMTTARMAALVASGNRAYALSAFYKEAESVRRTMNVSEHNGHRQAVSSFAARYSLDSRFSFAFLQRFNTQTRDVVEKTPNQIGNYLSAATGLAGQSSPQLMATFFDAVDTYLGDAEKQITAKAEEFFTMAAAEMGLSGEIVDTAKNQLIDRIEGFFNRVENALDLVESKFVPSPSEAPTAVPQPPVLDPSAPLPSSTADSLSNQIAVA